MSDKPFRNVDDILEHYKKREEMVFKRAEDAIEYFGWDRPINLAEVRKDGERRIPQDVPGANEAVERKRDASNDETNLPGASSGGS